MFGMMPAIRSAGGPFVWSGTFPILPASEAALVQWLGIDGSISADISANNHLWELKNPTTSDPDIGTLSTANWALTNLNPSQTTDPDFGGGSRNMLRLVNSNDSHLATVSNRTPALQEGQTSWLVGVVLKFKNNAPGLQYKHIANHHQSGFGWYIYRDSVSGALGATVDWGATIQQGFGAAVAEETPLLLLVNFDFAMGVIDMITPWNHNSYAVLTDIGQFSNNASFRLGWVGFNASIVADMALAFVVEYPAGTNSGIGAANIENFLKYTDGVLT